MPRHQISRLLMDAWISSPNGLEDAAEIYTPILDTLRSNMALVVVDTQPDTPEDFRLKFVRRYRVPTTFKALQALQRTGSFSEFADQDYLRNIMIPAYVEAAERQRPTTRRVVASLLGMTMALDRTILAQKNANGRSAWCIGLLDVRFLLPEAPQDPEFDDIDLAILQLLKEGAGAKEIAEILRISPRTAESRIGRLKAQFDARNITHLAALAISAGLGGGVSFQDE